mmetsp:Transcript_84265/g.238800  ORF Transcript_84265/g.238800 Transcript_84265/m.238800 type:complete len:371 (-) Transcript_84265:18-1130(-)
MARLAAPLVLGLLLAACAPGCVLGARTSVDEVEDADMEDKGSQGVEESAGLGPTEMPVSPRNAVEDVADMVSEKGDEDVDTADKTGAAVSEFKVTPCPPLESHRPPRNFRCFPLGDRLVCGMARPTIKQNPICGLNNRSVEEAAMNIMYATKKWAIAFREHFKLKRKPYNLVSIDHEDLPAIHEAAVAEKMTHHANFIVPDFKTPRDDLLWAFTELVLTSKPSEQMIVHCAGGMGRTGLFLIALMTRVFWEDGRVFFKDMSSPAKMEPFKEGERKLYYTSWMQPLQEAVRFVQRSYHPDAGEFINVQSNYVQLAIFMVTKLPRPKGPRAGYVPPEAETFAQEILDWKAEFIYEYAAFADAVDDWREALGE